MRYCFSFIALMIIATGCMSAEPQVVLNGQRYTVELALEPKDQALGLMFRDELPADRGMLFIFPDQRMRSFWMKNTRIPLDILYFDDQLRLVSVAENARPCRTPVCSGYPSAGPARYVLELNAGEAARLGVQPGDELELRLE